MKNQQSKNTGVLEYIKNNKKKTIVSIFILIIYTWMSNSDFLVMPKELHKYLALDTYKYTDLMGISLFIIVASFPLVITYKEKNIEDWHRTFNKIFWVFLIGIFSLTNVRNSYFYNIDNQKIIAKEVQYESK